MKNMTHTTTKKTTSSQKKEIDMDKLKFRHSLEDQMNERWCLVNLSFGSKNLGEKTYTISIGVDAIDGNDPYTGERVTQVSLTTEKVKGEDVTGQIAELVGDALGFFKSISYCDFSNAYQLNSDRLLTNAEVGMVIAAIYDIQANS